MTLPRNFCGGDEPCGRCEPPRPGWPSCRRESAKDSVSSDRCIRRGLDNASFGLRSEGNALGGWLVIKITAYDTERAIMLAAQDEEEVKAMRRIDAA